MRKYCAWHIGDPGWDTAREVEIWISRQENPELYKVVATDDDFDVDTEAERSKLMQQEWCIENRIEKAVKAERERIFKKLIAL